MTASEPVIRKARPEDESGILGLVARLVEFGPPAWRDAQRMVAVDRGKIAQALHATGEDPLVIVAVIDDRIAGFIHLHSLTDHYHDAPHGHVSDIVVAPDFEGHGVGRRLLEAAKDWAKAKRFRWLTISVFESNTRAL